MQAQVAGILIHSRAWKFVLSGTVSHFLQVTTDTIESREPNNTKIPKWTNWRSGSAIISFSQVNSIDNETESQGRDVFVPRHMAGMWDLNPCWLTPTHVGSVVDDSGGIE